MSIYLLVAMALLGGALIATCFWLSYIKASNDGYNAGYAKAQKEQADKEQAARMARIQAEAQLHNQMELVKGFPSAEYTAPRKPLGFQEVEA